MQIAGICRFSLLGRGDWKPYQGKDASQIEAVAKEQAARLFAPERMEARLRTFQQLTLASLRAQTDKDFVFIVLASEYMPGEYRTRLERICAEIPQVKLRFFDLITAADAQRAMFKELRLSYARTLQFRLDDDDCVPRDFVEALRREARAAFREWPIFTVTIPNVLYCVSDGPTAGQYHWPVEFLAVGLALRHPRRSVYEFGHFAMGQRFDSVKIADNFVLATHTGTNDTEISAERMARRGIVPLDETRTQEIIAAKFPFLTSDALELLGMKDRHADTARQTSDEDARDVLPKWLRDLADSTYKRGFFIADQAFALQHTDRGKQTLYVSFDNLSGPRAKSRIRDPWGYEFAERRGWSHLGVMAYQPRWFRHKRLFAELETLARQGFFNRFDKVLFAGTSMGGYAACAFSSLAPGSTVVAFSPQSTLAPELAGWDERYSSGSAADWSGPYADAAAELAGAGHAWVIYDPLVPEDEAHARRLMGPNVTLLPARYSGHFTAQFLGQIGILSTVMKQADSGTLTPARFREMYAKGKDYRRYLLGLAARAEKLRSDSSLLRLARVLRARGRPGIANQLLQGTGADSRWGGQHGH